MRLIHKDGLTHSVMFYSEHDEDTQWYRTHCDAVYWMLSAGRLSRDFDPEYDLVSDRQITAGPPREATCLVCVCQYFEP